MDKHDTILVACGTPEHRYQIRGALQERYHLLEADNTQQLLVLLEQNQDCIAALVLAMTAMEKVDMAALEQNEALLKQVPVILISENDSPELLHRGFGWGAADVIPVNYEPYSMLRRIETIVELHLHRQYLETMVAEQSQALHNHSQTMVDALSSIIEYRSVESGQHILRIRHFTRILLEEVVRTCPEYGLDERTVAIIAGASSLHDIGKIAIPDSILLKPGRLTAEEMDVMRTHSLTGCHILESIRDVADEEYLRYAHNICHYHHERWDGKGYPEGLAGDDIPICAQVVGLADVYDALTNKRVYKEAYSFTKTVNMILRGECGAFSPKLLECFKNVAYQFEELAHSYADGLSPKTERFDTTLPPPKKQEENSLERIRAKFSSLLHYIDGLLMEVNPSHDTFHLVYNPYPELSWLNDSNGFSDIVRSITERAVDQKSVENLFTRGIRDFLREDLRRSTHYFEFRGSGKENQRFEITLLRINPMDSGLKTIAVLARRTEKIRAERSADILSDNTVQCRNDADFTMVKMGEYVRELTRYTPEELQADFGGKLMELVLPEDRETLRRSFRQQLSQGTQAKAEFRIRRKDGSICWVFNRARITLDDQGREILHCCITDISESRRAYDALKEKLQRYEIILAQTENVLFEWDRVNNDIRFSDTWVELFGTQPSYALLSQGAFCHPDDLPLLLDRIANMENGSQYEIAEVRVVTSRGRYLWCRFRATAVRNEAGELTKIVGILINIDAEKQAQRLLQDRAERDALTKLLNKTAGRKQAEEYLARYPGGSTMLIIDLDNFKEINDQYGHLFGDAVLTKVAREIEKLFRSQDIISRIGGDEFLVLMRGVADRHLVTGRCERLLNIFASTFRIGKQKLPVSCSIGIAVSPEDGKDYYELFNHADKALYTAKGRGKNDFCFYDDQLERLPAAKRISAVGNAIDSDVEPGLAEDNLVRYAFQRLYSAEDPDRMVDEILALVGQKMQVSRVYIFENSDDNRFCSNTYEWCHQGIAPEKDNLQHISYETDIPHYEDNFDEQGIFYVPDIRQLPKHIYDILEPQGIKSMLHCAIRENGVFRGYIGFDECVEERMWTQDQIRLLQYFSEMLGIFLLNRRQRQKALIQAQELNSILDNQAGWLYVIDRENFTLKYTNAALNRAAPGAKIGKVCYRAIMGREEPCKGCPFAEKTGAAILRDEKKNIRVLAEATDILWQGENSCLMSCRKLPE